MIRVLIIDDQPPAYAGLITEDAQNQFGNEPELKHIDPTKYFKDEDSDEETVLKLIAEVKESASQFWDVVTIDLFLGDFYDSGLKDSNLKNIEVSLRVAEAVHEVNKSATLLLYSGTLAKYVDELLQEGASDTQLRKIFHAGISNFVPRNRVAVEVRSAIKNPSWLLRIDRMFMKHHSIIVDPKEAQFTGRSFADLAMSVRRQDEDGQQIAQILAEYGISNFAALNTRCLL